MFQQLLANKHHRLRDSVPITIWPSGGLRLVTDIKKNNNKNNKSRAKQEPRSAHGRAVKKKIDWQYQVPLDELKHQLNVFRVHAN